MASDSHYEKHFARDHFFAIAAFAAACKPSDDNSTSKQLDNVRIEPKADAREMKGYAYAQRAAFITSMQSQFDALNKDIDALSAKIESSSDAVKADANPNSRRCATRRPD
jgi:hypothetical protein